mgnify:CR=1 FL=1
MHNGRTVCTRPRTRPERDRSIDDPIQRHGSAGSIGSRRRYQTLQRRFRTRCALSSLLGRTKLGRTKHAMASFLHNVPSPSSSSLRDTRACGNHHCKRYGSPGCKSDHTCPRCMYEAANGARHRTDASTELCASHPECLLVSRSGSSLTGSKSLRQPQISEPHTSGHLFVKHGRTPVICEPRRLYVLRF